MTDKFAVQAFAWRVSDIQDLFDVTDEEAQEFMERNAGYFKDRMTELGWEVWETYGDNDGLKRNDDD